MKSEQLSKTTESKIWNQRSKQQRSINSFLEA